MKVVTFENTIISIFYTKCDFKSMNHFFIETKRASMNFLEFDKPYATTQTRFIYLIFLKRNSYVSSPSGF